MRLVCPNCGTQYDVDASAVPAEGRDVQCANCAHNWFQEAEASQSSDVPSAPAENKAPEVPTRHRRPPRTIGPDPEVLDILRQEAQREADARQGKSVTDEEVEAQIDFTKDLPQDPVEAQEDGAKRQRAERTRQNQVRERTRRLNIDTEKEAARAQAEAVVEDAAATSARPDDRPQRPARSNVLPNIEELKSSLRAGTERRSNEKSTTAAILSASSFRYGFLVSTATGLLLAAVYFLGPQIGDAIPQLSGAIDLYSQLVYGFRIRIDIAADAVASAAASLSDRFL
jgi:predicted Zn finger-like uncharacterized protein